MKIFKPDMFIVDLRDVLRAEKARLLARFDDFGSRYGQLPQQIEKLW
jgi:hypothetical protein